MSRENAQAALAQSVERRLGKAEVGGLVSLGSVFILQRELYFRLEGTMSAFFFTCPCVESVIN